MSIPRPAPETLLRSDKPDGSIVTSRALRMEQNGQVFYFITVPKQDIFPFCYVADRYENPSEGFQRELDVARAKQIAKYLDDSIGSIPTNIVLSAQHTAALDFDAENQLLRYTRCSKAFLVLDGQHRLFGYGLTKKAHLIPVAIYEGLKKKEEVALFMDINTTQRGVPAALLLDIKQLADREDDAEKELRELFDFLRTSTSSPLHGMMSPAKATRGMLSRPVFNRAAVHALKGPIMEQLPKQKRFELFENYLRSLDEVLRDPKILFQNAYLEAFCSIFEDVLRSAHEKHRNLKIDSLRSVVQPLSQLNVSEVSTKGRARLTKALIVPMLKQFLFGQPHIDDSMV